jgi:hypothetical protein
MYVLTQEENNIESGVYAGMDEDGDQIVQFFIDKDDAVTYTTLLEATGQSLFVTETDPDNVDKLCSALGFAYNIIEPGEIVFPRIETMIHDNGL